MNYHDPELRKQLVDEYVLGTLQGAARARFERLIRDDATLRHMVDKSSSQWNSLIESVPPVKPPAHLWSTVQHRIHPRPGGKPSATHTWVNFNFWKVWAVMATLVAIFLGIAFNQTIPFRGASANYFVLITDDAKSQASWMLGANQNTQTMTVKAISPQPLPENRVFQLWIKIKYESRVRSVGLIPANGEAIISLDPLEQEKNKLKSSSLNLT